MNRYKKNPHSGLKLGSAGLLLATVLVINLNPDIWWKELTVVCISWASFWLICSHIFKNIKWGGIISLAIFSIIILNRFGILDLLTGSLLIIIMGLISLIY
jgi:hypothetical protein